MKKEQIIKELTEKFQDVTQQQEKDKGEAFIAHTVWFVKSVIIFCVK